MKIGDLDFQLDIANAIDTHELFIGFSTEFGHTECCGERIIIVRFGFLLFSINILIQPAGHTH